MAPRSGQAAQSAWRQNLSAVEASQAQVAFVNSQENQLSLTRDALGIPVLDALDLEGLAERFLQHLAPSVLVAPQFTPLADIMTRLHSMGYLTFDLNARLGLSPKGHKYLGCYNVERKRISIDASLSDADPRFPFTVAHELAHFYLHSAVKLAALVGARGVEILDSTRDLVVHRVEAATPRSLIEWQANRFAAAVLIPRATLREAVTGLQKEMGITRNLGLVWVDQQPQSRRDYRETAARLTLLYRTSRAVVRYRLAELGISREFSAKGWPVQVGALLTDALRDLFGDRAAGQ